MNTTVTATGMQVSAKSDTLFLVIQEGDSFDNTKTATEVVSTHAAVTLMPVAHGTVDSDGNGTQADVTAAGDMTAPAKWYYAYSSANDDYEAAAKTAKACTSLTAYMISEVFSVGVNNKSGVTKAQNLKVTNVTIPAGSGIVLVLVCGSNVFEYKASIAGGTNVLATTAFTDTRVTAYYYIDGENENVYSDNAVSLTGKVQFTLEAEGATA